MFAFKIVVTTLVGIMIALLLTTVAKMETKTQRGTLMAFIVTYAAALVAIWG